MSQFNNQFFSVSTAEDQQNYFTGEIQDLPQVEYGATLTMKAGTYRVIDGKLFPIISGLPPEIEKAISIP